MQKVMNNRQGDADMLDNLNQRLAELREKIRHWEALQNRLRSAHAMLSQESARLRNLKSTLREEETDVEKLEGLSLTALFHSILGSKTQQLEKERQEYLAVKLKYDECQASFAALEQEISNLNARLKRCENPGREYEAVLKEKERLIAEADDDTARILAELSQQLADRKADMRELQEAIQAGEAAGAALQDVARFLKSAGNWGTWDLLGGGLIATAVKHSKIDNARASAHDAQVALRRFERELKDVGSRLSIVIDIGSFATFTDYFFDGLIADWFVQSRISQSLESVQKTKRHVDMAMDRLRTRLNDVEKDAADVKSRTRALIENT